MRCGGGGGGSAVKRWDVKLCCASPFCLSD